MAEMMVVALGLLVLAFQRMLFSGILTKKQSNLISPYNYTRDYRSPISAFSNQRHGDDQITLIFMMGDYSHFMKPLSLLLLLFVFFLLCCCFAFFFFFKDSSVVLEMCGEEGEEQGFPYAESKI